MKFKSRKQQQAVMSSLNANKSKSSKFQSRMKKVRTTKSDVWQNEKLLNEMQKDYDNNTPYGEGEYYISPDGEEVFIR